MLYRHSWSPEDKVFGFYWNISTTIFIGRHEFGVDIQDAHRINIENTLTYLLSLQTAKVFPYDVLTKSVQCLMTITSIILFIFKPKEAFWFHRLWARHRCRIQVRKTNHARIGLGFSDISGWLLNALITGLTPTPVLVWATAQHLLNATAQT